jgi:hypothetical protein
MQALSQLSYTPTQKGAHYSRGLPAGKLGPDAQLPFPARVVPQVVR